MPKDAGDRYRPFWDQTFLDLMPKLISYALRLVNGRRYDADDLVQETFCRISTYPADPDKITSPLGYLLTIMRRIWSTKWRMERTAITESLDELLKQGAQQKQQRILQLAKDPDVLRIIENKELRDEMREKQGPLTEREEHLVELYLEGHTRQEIATILGVDVYLVCFESNRVLTKVRGRIQKGRKR